MKKRNYLLLLSGAFALGLTSCGGNSGVTGDSLSVSSGDPEAKYQVSETYWNANITQGGFFGVNHNLTMNVSIESADGAIRRANIANANGSLHMVFQGTEETYLELLEDRSYNVYMLENGKWGKENLPATFLATLTPMLQSFIAPWSYADFTYNASTHAYEKASGEVTFAGLEGSAENIAFRFEDSKLLSLNFKFTVEGVTSDFSLSVANWGSTTIAFPKVDEPTSSTSDPSGGGSSASDSGTSGTSDTTPVTGATISLSEDEFTMMIYQNHEITATISPEDSGETITWSSSSEIALIEGQNRNGGRTVNIKAEGIGTAIITASLPNGASASCTITIVNDPDIVIPPQSMTISQETLSMNVGEITELSVTVLPKGATYNQIIWTVDRKGVVDVVGNTTDMTKATITAVGSGTAVIEAILTNQIEARCTVTVSGGGGTPTVEVTSITLSQKSLSMNVNDTAELTATIMPKNATIKEVTWSAEG
ncbi:MAG: Ig-like domain-containing protein, partial [Bacilli bacterium]|nr:Ig-like domain-containing protein [Bacilli bacterium]